MIRLEFSPTELSGDKREWWEKWEARAKEAVGAAKVSIEAGESHDLDQEIWAEMKRWMFEHVFFNKCAYCEGKVTPQSYGDGEHWRPKGGIRQMVDGKLRPVERDGVPHPGYWWLAYEWSNLLPACQRCNSSPGKGMQFPVAGEYVFEPGDAAGDDLDNREAPLLLHPLRGDDPEDHLGFDEFGQVFPREESQKGTASIEVFNLNREPLAEHRRAFIERGQANFQKALIAAVVEDRPVEEVIREMFDVATDYSAAVRSHAYQWVQEMVSANLTVSPHGSGG
ncbi:MAG TPA: hypothetical protein VHR18_11495 [Solirubrobacterales bacterium]|jgi:hypothetical protein|nr:hypothetical protein [Solirubrobacterales bacterium]